MKRFLLVASLGLQTIIRLLTRLGSSLMLYLYAINNQLRQDECKTFRDNLLLQRLKAKQPPGSDRLLEYPWAIERVPVTEGRLLDVGSTACELFLATLPKPLEIHGLNLNPKPVKDERIKFTVGDIRRSPYPDGHFDVITCISTLEHIGVAGRYNSDEDPDGDKRALADMHRILKPGGTLLITVPYGAADVLPINKLYTRERFSTLFADWEIVALDYRRFDPRFRIWLKVDERIAADTDMLRDGWYAIAFITVKKPNR